MADIFADATVYVRVAYILFFAASVASGGFRWSLYFFLNLILLAFAAAQPGIVLGLVSEKDGGGSDGFLWTAFLFIFFYALPAAVAVPLGLLFRKLGRWTGFLATVILFIPLMIFFYAAPLFLPVHQWSMGMGR